MKVLKHFFENYSTLVANQTNSDSDFFTSLSKQQSPEYLGIGCSDSQ
jgi:carbonic anhydrase